ncbi:hypothetical protein CF140_08625 [Aeromonas sobria]|jgi:hypothetical protein|nr:hypothetical protein [Aeromonas veronii]TNH84571.1 hypothetical protein CF140_08625 [Aeromonas sobria]
MDRTDWLIRFRRAKTHETLDMMLEGALRKSATTRDAAEAILGHEARQDEIDRMLHIKHHSFIDWFA